MFDNDSESVERVQRAIDYTNACAGELASATILGLATAEMAAMILTLIKSAFFAVFTDDEKTAYNEGLLTHAEKMAFETFERMRRG